MQNCLYLKSKENISYNLQEMVENKSLVSLLLCESELTRCWRSAAGGADSPVTADEEVEVIKRAPVKAQMMENIIQV